MAPVILCKFVLAVPDCGAVALADCGEAVRLCRAGLARPAPRADAASIEPVIPCKDVLLFPAPRLMAADTEPVAVIRFVLAVPLLLVAWI
jgi:hypothetical protein